LDEGSLNDIMGLDAVNECEGKCSETYLPEEYPEF